MKLVARSGFLEVYHDDGCTHITFMGNMGNSLVHVDERLAALGYPSLEVIKRRYAVVVESGTPDYAYCLVVKGNIL